jgi:ABC-type amino acid transport substrate-binding protein
MPDDRFAQRVTYSEPYSYASYQYVLSADNKSIDLERALATEVIALESGIAVRGLTDRQLKRYSSLESILDAVAAGRIQAGYVISSRAHWLAAEKWPGQLQFAQPKSEIDCFPICVALRRGETELREEINSAFRQLRHSGQLEQAFMRWHVPLGASSIHSDSPQ